MTADPSPMSTVEPLYTRRQPQGVDGEASETRTRGSAASSIVKGYDAEPPRSATKTRSARWTSSMFLIPRRSDRDREVPDPG
jgi:hypothetical protein